MQANKVHGKARIPPGISRLHKDRFPLGSEAARHQRLLAAVDSTGRCNSLVKLLGRRFVAQSLSRTLVQASSNSI